MKESQDIHPHQSLKALLVGEACLDEYFYGMCNRLSPEAPVPVLDFTKFENKYGMVLNVANNVRSFGVDVDVLSNEPTELIKRRFIDATFNHQLLRLDIALPLTPLDFVPEVHHDFVIISDYNKGLLNREYLSQLIAKMKDLQIPVFVDSKRDDLSVFDGCIIKVNKQEFDRIKYLPEEYELIITLGKNGAVFNGVYFPAPHADVFDVTGAGDVFIASLACLSMRGLQLNDAIPLAIALATRSVQHAGIYTITENDIHEICN